MQASLNEAGACDWYNGKEACPTCQGLTTTNISLEGYQELMDGSIEFSCGDPPSACKDYLVQFLCGYVCFLLFIIYFYSF